MGRWDELIRFVEAWYAKDGTPADDLAAAEAGLGRPLPAAVREAPGSPADLISLLPYVDATEGTPAAWREVDGHERARNF